MAKKKTPVAETTEETNAPDESVSDASEETTSNEVESEVAADETTSDTAETPAVEAVDEAPAEAAVEATAETAEEAPSESQSPAAERVEVEGGRDYELIFIVRITESTDEAAKRARAIIEESGGAVDNVRISEQRRLQYPIKKEIEGFYVIINGRFTKEAAAELDRVLKLDEAVLRHMTIRLDEE